MWFRTSPYSGPMLQIKDSTWWSVGMEKVLSRTSASTPFGSNHACGGTASGTSLGASPWYTEAATESGGTGVPRSRSSQWQKLGDFTDHMTRPRREQTKAQDSRERVTVRIAAAVRDTQNRSRAATSRTNSNVGSRSRMARPKSERGIRRSAANSFASRSICVRAA